MDNILKNNGYRFVTHAGSFHADDVMSAALVNILTGDNQKFERVREVKEEDLNDPNTMVFDIGMGEFDHHQDIDDKKIRPNGIPYAAFGLIWKKYGSQYLMKNGHCDPETADAIASRFDFEFIQSMDNTDNYGQCQCPNALSRMISDMNPKDLKESDGTFNTAVGVFTPLLKGMIDKLIDEIEYINKAKKLESNGLYAILSEYIPNKIVSKVRDDIKWIISENPRGGYSVQSLNSSKWPICATGEEGCTFNHPAKFMAVFDTKDNAVKYCEKILNSDG